jgi:hypothetical protein
MSVTRLADAESGGARTRRTARLRGNETGLWSLWDAFRPASRVACSPERAAVSVSMQPLLDRREKGVVSPCH